MSLNPKKFHNSFQKKLMIKLTKIFIGAVLALLMVACANIGRPEGGARDELPPVYVRSTPAMGARNVDRQRLDVWFDENIQLDDAFNKVIVSPTQTTPPTVRSVGRHLYVELRDSLQPDATYTIDFADAIKDLNEGNILDGFAMDFSTGADLDTLRISGMVLAARNLEPAQGMTVGIYSNPTDTSITKVQLERIARTNQYGQFTVRNLKPGNYAVYAINDVNRDHKWDRSEDVAFLGTLVSPSVEAITVNDTLRSQDLADSIVTRPGVHYMPDDILLTWFNEDYKSQYLKDHDRPERRKVTLGFAAPSDTLPTLTIVGGPMDGRDFTSMTVLEKNADNDSLIYWMRDSALMAIDSLQLNVRHQFTDTLDQLVWQNDTIRFFFRDPKQKKKKKKEGEEADSIPPRVPLDLRVSTPAQHEIYAPLQMHSATPIATVDTLGIHLEMTADTVWHAAALGALHPDSINPVLDLVLDFDRQPGMKYRLTVDSAAVTDIYGLHNNVLEHEFTVKMPEEYSSVAFTITGTDTVPVVVELLNQNDNPVQTRMLRGTHHATFGYLTPGTYFARLFIDANGNGKWDTGNITDSIQPEEVYYYGKKLDLRANWDVEQSWNIYELALDKQKPNAIKKNKPKLRKGETAPTDEDIEYDEWGNPIDPNDMDYLNGSGGRRNNNNRGGNRGNSFGGFGGLGGLQQNTGTTVRPNVRR